MEHTSGQNIAEALETLDEAARQKKDELRSVMSDKYAHFKRVIVETEGALAKSLSDARRQAVAAAAHARDVGVEKAREVVDDVDGSVRNNPWPYIGGTAVIGLILGYTFGRNRK